MKVPSTSCWLKGQQHQQQYQPMNVYPNYHKIMQSSQAFKMSMFYNNPVGLWSKNFHVNARKLQQQSSNNNSNQNTATELSKKQLKALELVAETIAPDQELMEERFEEYKHQTSSDPLIPPAYERGSDGAEDVPLDSIASEAFKNSLNESFQHNKSTPPKEIHQLDNTNK